jgi:hypothetical protein
MATKVAVDDQAAKSRVAFALGDEAVYAGQP